MVSRPGDALLVLLVLSSCGGLTGAIVTGWGTPTLCDTSYCKCDAVKSKIECSCEGGNRPKEIVLQANGTNALPPSTSLLHVENCYQVTVKSNAFSSLVSLKHIEIYNIKHLVIESHAFNWNHKPMASIFLNGGETSLSVELKNSSLPELPSYAFEGRHASIVLQKLKITVIRSYAFTNLQNGISFHTGSRGELRTFPETYNTEMSIQIKDCDVGSVEALAFRRIAAAELVWMGGRVGAFLQRALFDVTLIGYDFASRGSVTRPPGARRGLGINGGLRIENLQVGKMESSAMYISRISSFQMNNCSFSLFDGGAIRAAVDAPVIRNCYFEKLGSSAFLALQPDRGLEHLEAGPSSFTTFLFENNTIGKFENASLLVHPAYMLRANSIRLDRACLCSSMWKWALTAIGYVNHNVERGATVVHTPGPSITEAEALYKVLECRPNDGEKYSYFTQVEKQICKHGFSLDAEIGIGVVVIAVLICLVIAILLTVVAIVCIRRKKRKPVERERQGKAWIGVPTYERDRKNKSSGTFSDENTSIMSNGQSEPKGREFMVVMPDLKTYRETELHVIVERAEPLNSEGNPRQEPDPKTLLLENEDYSDAEKTSL
ncbi:uncharacterized protein LOC124159032 [Ischnura elegans]|uniref:uncharacterized protein LOC124159032 n=1 Tax=Ischnura elegans TaxID=197161 RepID=UPI001ED889BB|nr:uncharacterized protein LOC124159032 [Ischnura elegans]